jgi:hypothetical protein
LVSRFHNSSAPCRFQTVAVVAYFSYHRLQEDHRCHATLADSRETEQPGQGGVTRFVWSAGGRGAVQKRFIS